MSIFSKKQKPDHTVANNAVSETLSRIKANIDSLKDEKSKQILFDLLEALIVLFVSSEPKLADPKINVDDKIMPFFKSIGKLALDGIEAYTMGGVFPKKLKDFENKIEKFKHLEEYLILLTK